MILLVIQFGWTSKTLEMDRQALDTKVKTVLGKIRKQIILDKELQQNLSSASNDIKDFVSTAGSNENTPGLLKIKLDSLLRIEDAPVSKVLYTRIGNNCYLMSYVPDSLCNHNIDYSQYRLCLCSNHFSGPLDSNGHIPVALDIGINLKSSSQMFATGASGLIISSVILIFLLIALFGYTIHIINRQKKLAELKNDFINNLTHEFNTPLFSMGITSNLLLRSETIQQSEKLKSYIELITTEKNRIQVQVDKILQLTAIESGSVIMEIETVNVHELLKEAIKSFEIIVAEKNGKIALDAKAEDHYVKADRIHLLNAINNLLDNACKYADKAISIDITTRNVNDELLISVTDNGVGMTRNETSMIFNKFYRVKNGDRHDVKGFGLGLSYVKKIIELHKGSIEVNSTPGEGSVFIIHLPYSSNK